VLFHAEDGMRGATVTGVQTFALPISIRTGDFAAKGGTVKSPVLIVAAMAMITLVSATGWAWGQRIPFDTSEWKTDFTKYSVPFKIGRASCRERVESRGGRGEVSRLLR